MPANDIKDKTEVPQIDETSLKMLEDHSCCAPVGESVRVETQPGDASAAAHDAAQRKRGAGVMGIRRPTGAQRFSLKVRIAGFFSVAVLILGTALWLVRPMDMGEQAADYTVLMSMSGFNPPSLDFPAGKAVTVKLVNNESPFHASGAEHQFAIDALGINVKLEAKQTRVITIQPQKPGQYTFYCDVCCGGQKSPTMRGTLTFY